MQKLVDAGKLTSAGAAQLNQLKPGAFCLHKSWGFGRVADWNLLLNQILIDFEKKKVHPMQVQYAAENLTPIPADHFLARKANDLPARISGPLPPAESNRRTNTSSARSAAA